MAHEPQSDAQALAASDKLAKVLFLMTVAGVAAFVMAVFLFAIF